MPVMGKKEREITKRKKILEDETSQGFSLLDIVIFFLHVLPYRNIHGTT